LEPTTVCSGTARNMVPAEARCTIDVRTNPKPTSEELLERLRWVIRGELRVLSDRLRPCTIDPDHPLVHAAQRARPQARCFGSRGVSDLVFFQAAGIPGIKVGPGKSERSHTPDEYVLESEVLEGARFFEQLVKQVLKEADP
jgi:acetylornithine deacetylase